MIKIDEITLRKAIITAKNIAQIMKNLNRADSSAGRKRIIKLINEFNIDISHFETTKERYERSLKIYIEKNIRIPLHEIFIENSTYTTGKNLKKILFKNNIKEHICEKCGQNEDWHGEKISLILDHINGIHNDNRIENLRILCPNCNATLLTHCRGAKGLIKDDLRKENKLIHYRKISLTQRKVIRPNFDVLKHEINELGYRGTGKRYGVSDNAIRKWIKFYSK
jgi:hypothetical protein